MPEQLTRHPEVTLQVLRSAGRAASGVGAAHRRIVVPPALPRPPPRYAQRDSTRTTVSRA